MNIPTDIESIPTNPDEIYALLGVTEQEPEGEQTADVTPEPEATTATATTEAAQEAEPKDQKLVPLSAVFSEREKTRALRERAAAAEARIEELEKAAEEGRVAADGKQLSDDELAEIEEALPEIGKALRSQQSRLSRLESENLELKAEKIGRDRVATEDEKVEAQKGIAEALAATPKLAHLDKTLSVEAWNARVAPIDDQLRSDPEFSKLPHVERLAKVAEIYEYRYGPVAISNDAQQTTQQRAAAALKAAGSPELSTLSDLPGGTVPDSPERDIERMSVHDLANLDQAVLDRIISKLA